VRRRRDLNATGFDPERQPGESHAEWSIRVHANAGYLREKAALEGVTPRRRVWLLERADRIDAGDDVDPYSIADESGLRAV
jgi:hypothetical protein